MSETKKRKKPLPRIKGFCKDCAHLNAEFAEIGCLTCSERCSCGDMFESPEVSIEDPSIHYCSMFEEGDPIVEGGGKGVTGFLRSIDKAIKNTKGEKR